MTTVTEPAIYVYAVGRGLSREAIGQTEGVGGAAVRLIEEEGLAAVVSPVSLDDFGEDALRRNLEDLRWLESTARTHNTVVAAAAGQGVSVPLGLATVYRNEERAREALRERRAEFDRALNRITGRTEWGVKAYAEPTAVAEPTQAEPADARPGTAYLRRRGAQRRSEEEARQEIFLAADRIDEELCALAATRRLHRPQDPQLSGERGQMILNAAYLVDDERADDFRAAVARLAGLRPEIRLQLTGPWAPYSFATEEEAWTEV
jgi:hypothetical protein